ncbi:[LSU ribosomal protein L11P]-lysine N-methyltransferase [Arachidicoccus rhizosphaerae]|uniref:Ribosomal protein L11 methyltransferase n=1 Tax=Arachidicoccus rhizosphaerae TaxID=551991 RepID=A0A1H3XD99_9BACT|nr:50S ribosomal protein L11 methyltransferase [Arachidicoccus rhizosphaerae]SDZ97376.1 [LSU ribosomal protein L11P]-lysine N-methyltransferase [Arachidicoccus rhizosphaerae]
MTTYKEIEITGLKEGQLDLLVGLLSEAGYSGFEELEEGHILKAFIDDSDFDQALLQDLLEPYGTHFTTRDLEEQNWNALWESNFEPVVVDDFVAIRADFHKQAFNTEFEILITPKMSFGTGHHATTYMMVSQMRHLEWAGKKVLDFGTGTGILAILANKLGAKEILALDNDDWSIENATENILSNNCHHIKVKKAHTAATDGHYEIILANINRNVIIANAEILTQSLATGGDLLISGLLQQDEADIKNLFIQLGLTYLTTVYKAQWIAMHFKAAK